MARAERNEEKNVKNYNYEWQTDEEIVANAHTKMSFHGREETTLADIIGTDDAEVFRQAHKLWLKLKEAFNREGADYDPALCNNGARKKYYVENNHPAIIDAATFGKVQEELVRRAGKKKVKQIGTKTELGKYCGKYALTERLICGECKTPYRRCTWTVKGKKKIVWRCINRLDFGKKYCHNSPTIEEGVLHEAIMEAIQRAAQQNMDTLQTLKAHIGIGLGTAEKEDNTMEIEFRIAQIDAEFKTMIETASADTVDGFDENRMQQLIAEKNELQEKLGEITEERGRQQTVQDRLETIYTVLDGLKNHPMTYDDEVVRQLIDCVVVESKDRIKVVFCGGLQVEQPLRQECIDFVSEIGQIAVNI